MSSEKDMSSWPTHARFDGSIVMIGFGSIGRGALPLILRHIACDPARLVVIAPDDEDRQLVEQAGGRFLKQALTEENYRDILLPLLTADDDQSFMVNLSGDVSSVAMVDLCKDVGALSARSKIMVLKSLSESARVPYLGLLLQG